MTHSIALMDVSPAAHAEIEQALRTAGYDHAIEHGVLDMSGLALVCAAESNTPKTEALEGVREPGLLAKKHTGMRVDYSGLLKSCQHSLKARGDTSNAEMLRQLQGHLQELGQRWYAGDVAVVDEVLQLYCIEKDARAALAATPAAPRSAAPGWVPIETAPRGTLVLLACAGWDPRPENTPIKVGGWWDNQWDIFGASWEPTHWMPLPTPPSEGGKQ